MVVLQLCDKGFVMVIESYRNKETIPSKYEPVRLIRELNMEEENSQQYLSVYMLSFKMDRTLWVLPPIPLMLTNINYKYLGDSVGFLGALSHLLTLSY